MKSLKRTLCLVLALVMVLGLFGAASASSFTDDNTIQYKEAVDVMTAIGAISGYDDGSFNPKGTINRAEAAKLVTYTVLGADAAERLAGDISPFTDVTVAGGWGWAIPSIAYLTKLGVINGLGDGTFNPKGEITGYAVAKMLLCALGYGAKGEYTGTSWEFQVAVDAGRHNVLNDRAPGSSTLSAPATREEVALYCLNTIQEPMVEYVSTLDVYRNVGTTAQGQTNKTIMNAIYDSPIALNKVAYYEGGVDTFGNPANSWTYGTKAIGAYAVTPTFSYTAETKADVIAKDLKDFRISGILYADGDVRWSYEDGNIKVDENKRPYYIGIQSAEEIANLTGNGTRVNVYTKGGQVETVTVVHEILAEVAYVDSAKETVQLTTVKGKTGSLAGLGPVSFTTPVGYGKVKTGDYVIITVKTGHSSDGKFTPVLNSASQVVSVTPATTVSGPAVKTSTSSSSITVNGTAYKAAANFDMSGFKVTDKSDATLILDSFGYVVYAKEGKTISRDNIIAVTDVYQTLADGKITKMVKGITSDGEEVALINNGKGDVAEPEKGQVLAYKETDGKFAFNELSKSDRTGSEAYKPEDADDANNKTPYAFVTTLTDNLDKSSKNATTAYTDGTKKTLNYYFSSDIKFVFAMKDNAGTPTKDEADVTVLTGVQNVAAKDEDGDSLNQRVVYALKPAGKTYEVAAVFVIEGEPDTVASAATDLIFLAKVDGERAVDGKTYNAYTMLKAGAPVDDAYGTADKASMSNPTGLVEGTFYTGVKDETTGAWKLKAFGTGKNNLQAQPASVVGEMSDSKTIVTSKVITGVGKDGKPTYDDPVTLDISKATIINLDTQGIGNKDQIAAGLAEMNNWMTNGPILPTSKVPFIAAIYDENSQATLVYYFTKTLKDLVESMGGQLPDPEPSPGLNEVTVTFPANTEATMTSGRAKMTITCSDGTKAVNSGDKVAKGSTLTFTVSLEDVGGTNQGTFIIKNGSAAVALTAGKDADTPKGCGATGQDLTQGIIVTNTAPANVNTVSGKFTFTVPNITDTVTIAVTNS